jgi:hypothetical protein
MRRCEVAPVPWKVPVILTSAGQGRRTIHSGLPVGRDLARLSHLVDFAAAAT